MHLWRNSEGNPSLADAALVSGGSFIAIAISVSAIDPILNALEPKGTIAGLFGYLLIFVLLAILVGGIGFLLWNSQNEVRDEVRFPRIVFAITSMVLVSIIASIGQSFFTIRYLVEHPAVRESFSQISHAIQFGAIILVALAYLATSRAAVRFPEATKRYLIYFTFGLSILGLVAKAARLFVRR